MAPHRRKTVRKPLMILLEKCPNSQSLHGLCIPKHDTNKSHWENGLCPHTPSQRDAYGLMDHITNIEMTCDTTFMLAWNHPREPAKML